MDSLQLREIILSLGKDLSCPFCKEPIPAASIELSETDSEENYSLHVDCPHCNEEFGGVVAAVSKSTPLGKMMNASSLVEETQKNKQAVEKDDILHVHNALESFQSFSEILPEEKK